MSLVGWGDAFVKKALLLDFVFFRWTRSSIKASLNRRVSLGLLLITGPVRRCFCLSRNCFSAPCRLADKFSGWSIC